MAQLRSIIAYLDALLENHLYLDRSINGLQVEAPAADIRKIGVSVDAGLSVIERAVEEGVNLLITHHGLLYGDLKPITGAFAKKMELLFRNRISLYGCHLPLDGNKDVGNAFCCARYLGLQQLQEFIPYKARTIGVRGQCELPKSFSHFSEKMRLVPGASHFTELPFGVEKISSVAIATGAAAFAIDVCTREGIDLFISGEPTQESFHLAKELKINVLFAGHYATETFGVRAIGDRLERDLGVESIFIDEPTGI